MTMTFHGQSGCAADTELTNASWTISGRIVYSYNRRIRNCQAQMLELPHVNMKRTDNHTIDQPSSSIYIHITYMHALQDTTILATTFAKQIADNEACCMTQQRSSQNYLVSLDFWTATNER
jgi:hypothetical protein